MDKDIELLLDAEAIQLKKLQEIVKKTIAEESLIINNLLNQPQEILTRGQSISDKVASFGGSWKFIITFGFILLIWIIYNSVTIINQRFDPYPFEFNIIYYRGSSSTHNYDEPKQTRRKRSQKK